MTKLFIVAFVLLASGAFAQHATDPMIFRITSAHTSFPDTARAKGHSYDNVLYTAAEHYNDSSVMIIVPPGLKSGKQVDIVCWFHGWRNNIDSLDAQFAIIKQFLASHRNAILLLPETTKNAPDSYGGKLEQPNNFKLLLKDVLAKLKNEKIIHKHTVPGNVVLAGHSGAFRVMAYILQQGGVAIKQTILFDGLYSQVDKFSNWIQQDEAHHFINLYTNKGGGTDAVSAEMMQVLRERNILFISAEEKDVNATLLKTNRVIFIHSLKEHNNVVNRPDENLKLFLDNVDGLAQVFPERVTNY